ncbi:MAG: hypothetical protein GX275_05140 [Clostridiales bacterium]|nr:hypothetical protein [Clostridiales bacterium]
MFIEKDGKNKNFYKYFITFVIGCLFVLMLFLVKGSFIQISDYSITYIDIIFCTVIIMLFLGLFFIRNKVDSKKILIALIILGLFLRIIYAFSIHSIPISDFAIMYETAGDVLKGDFSNLWGNGYIARFPHITIPVLYFSAIRFIFENNSLLVIKLISVIASSCNILLGYLIIKEVFKERFKANVVALIIALYPPLILYTAVYTTENLAIPLYLLGIYLFILVCNGKRGSKTLFLAATVISLGNLFRMVGQVIIIALILYLIVSYRAALKKKLAAILIVILGFLIPLVGISSILHYSGIIEYQLWGGSEPSITNVVKGLNVEYEGRWNPDDAKIPEDCNFDYELIEEKSKTIIHERLTNTPTSTLVKFFINKYTSQWRVGDFSGSYWAEHSISDDEIGFKYSENGIWYGQMFHFIIICLVYIGLFNLKEIRENRIISLFYYIFCGYGLLYLVSENQARYGFVVCWIFIFMASSGIDLLKKLIIKIKEKV